MNKLYLKTMRFEYRTKLNFLLNDGIKNKIIIQKNQIWIFEYLISGIKCDYQKYVN